VCRINFETEQLEGLAERQASIQTSSEKTLKSLERITVKKQQIQKEMQEIDQEIEQLSSRHDELIQAQSAKSAIVSEAKKELSKVNKALDATLRDIGGLVRVYSACRQSSASESDSGVYDFRMMISRNLYPID
jgi:chromosome segregation ATPase